MHFVDPDKMRTYRSDSIPEVIMNHERVAEHYGISSINLAKEVTDRIDNQEFTWEEDFKNLHPSPFGQGIYARSIIDLLKTSYAKDIDSDAIEKSYPIPDPLDRFSYDQGELVDVQYARFDQGWSYDPNWIPKDSTGTRANYTHVPMLITTEYDQPLTFEFKGQAVGIAVASGFDAGIIKYRIDEGVWKELNLKTRWSDYLHLPWYYTLEAEIQSGVYTLELKLLSPGDDNATACRIRYFYVNK